MPEFPIDPDLSAVTAALRGLAPSSPALDRDRLLYEAGRRSVRSRPWPIVAGLFAVLAAGLGTRLATVPPRIEVVYVSPPPVSRDAESAERSAIARNVNAASPLTEEPLPRSGYLHLRDEVVRFGADSMPAAAAAGSALPPPPVEQLLGLPAGTLSNTQKARWAHQLYRGDV